MKNNHWTQFLKYHKGHGLSLQQLSVMYHQTGGAFMCCQTLQEEEAIRSYIKTYQRELVEELSWHGIHGVYVSRSHTKTGELGRFIISFADKFGRELYHFTLVCGPSHWDEHQNVREPHFTVGDKDHYFYVFDQRLIYRDSDIRPSPIPQDVVDAMSTMLTMISPEVCQVTPKLPTVRLDPNPVKFRIQRKTHTPSPVSPPVPL
jgi:hypothetical protein